MQTTPTIADAMLAVPVATLLRHATAAHHTAIESVLRLDGPFGLQHYAAVLHGFELFLSAWEPQVMAALPPRLHDWFAQRSRLALVRSDCVRLGPANGFGAAWRTKPGRLDLATPAAAFGSMYVMEGSALGGLLIAKQVGRTLGLGPDNGAAYFGGSGHATAAGWREFGVLLEAEVGSATVHRDAACAAAQATFAALTDTFRNLPHDDHAAA